MNDPDAWSAYDAGNTAPLTNTKGYQGGIYDGKYMYFVPITNGSHYHAKVLRYDTALDFSSSFSWLAYDAENTVPLTNTIGYYGAIFDGKYVYFVPWFNGDDEHGKILRYDTIGSDFSSASSWIGYDTGSINLQERR